MAFVSVIVDRIEFNIPFSLLNLDYLFACSTYIHLRHETHSEYTVICKQNAIGNIVVYSVISKFICFAVKVKNLFVWSRIPKKQQHQHHRQQQQQQRRRRQKHTTHKTSSISCISMVRMVKKTQKKTAKRTKCGIFVQLTGF